MKSSPLPASSTPLRRSGRLPARSKQRNRDMVTRRRLVSTVLRQHPWCQARLLGCEGRSVEVHEPLSRGRGGSFLDESNVLALCRHCHQWVTDHPEQAGALGLIVPSQPLNLIAYRKEAADA